MHFHILQPIDYVVYAWLFVAALSALYVGLTAAVIFPTTRSTTTQQ